MGKQHILVTGGTGFFGSHLCAELKRRDLSFSAVGSGDADLCNYNETADLIRVSDPSTVVHLAASVGGIGANMDRPATFWSQNLMMGMNVFEACAWWQKQNGTSPRIILAGTTCSYPKHPAAFPFKEDEIYDGYPEETNAPYGIAKRALMTGLDAYRRQHGIRSCCLVFTNLYGEKDNFDLRTSHVIPAMIRKILAAKDEGRDEVTLWGTGQPTRDLLYAGDAAVAVAKAIEHDVDTPSPINIGTSKQVTMEDLADMIALSVGWGGKVIWDDTKPDGQPRRALDVEHARLVLGWVPQTDLEVGIDRVVAWYEAYRAVKKLRSDSDAG